MRRRRKLVLRAETVAVLATDLDRVRGGFITGPAATDGNNGCPSEATGCHTGWTGCGSC